MNSEKFIERELARLNLHLPAKKISLKDALSMEKPMVVTREGGIHSFDRAELEFLAGLLSEEERERLKLPILIILDPKLGRGAARVSESCERKIIGKILEKEINEETVIYRPEVAIIRKKLPTTSQHLFVP